MGNITKCPAMATEPPHRQKLLDNIGPLTLLHMGNMSNMVVTEATNLKKKSKRKDGCGRNDEKKLIKRSISLE